MTRPDCALDIECFSNWFLVGITCKETRSKWDFHLVPGSFLDVDSIRALLSHFRTITFNGAHYDLLMLTAALAGYDNAQLKALNDQIITSGQPSWMIAKQHGLWTPDYIDHVDVMSVIPGVPISLKLNAGRLHVPTMVETAVDFTAPMPFEKINEETLYCQNDREVTLLLADTLSDRLAMRQMLSDRYQVDLRSKSDAQIAEAVVKAEWQRRIADCIAIGQKIDCDYTQDRRGNPQPVKRVVKHGYSFKYQPPLYINFVTPQLQEVYRNILDLDFIVEDKENAIQMGADPDAKIKTGVVMPEYLRKLVIKIGGSSFKMGIGGLHSQESCTVHRTIPGVCRMKTADVASYYPALMINLRMIPSAIGSLFQEIYPDIRAERLYAKANKKHDKKMATLEGGLKIVLNGTFGKLWSKHSIFFAPEQGVRVTLTGQLALLMLIERLELAGIKIVSANTDGIEMCIPSGLETVAEMVTDWWQKVTALELEQEYYESLWSRDVNNYIRIDGPGQVKRKGCFRSSGVLANKTPKNDICYEAVVQYIAEGRPIEETIRACEDIRMFITVRKAGNMGYYHHPMNPVIKDVENGVTGGVPLGKAVRWYYSNQAAGCMIVNHKGDKVSDSDGAMPCMTLPNGIPSDLDFERYIEIAKVIYDELTFPF